MRTSFLMMVAMVLFLTGPFTIADPPPPEAPETPEAHGLQSMGVTPTLLEKVTAAYAQTQQYQATVRFRVDQVQGRWTRTQEADFYIVFDRAGQRLVIDKPDLRLVVNDGRLRMDSDQVPGAYLDIDASDPITWSSVTQAVSFVAEPTLPDTVFLTARDPVSVLSQGGTIKMGDAQLWVTRPEGLMTLQINPETFLIDSAVMEMDTARFGGRAEDRFTIDYAFDVTILDQPIPDEAFVFDTTLGQPADSIEAMMQIAQGGGGAGGSGGHPLQDQKAPEIESVTAAGEVFKLSEVEADVIVLDFWATWCPPCRKGLPHIQAVADWAEQEGKSVAVYAVNVGETVDQVKAFWVEQGFTMPAVMDEQSRAASAYNVQGIPQTVVIADGKVIEVYVGLAPNLEQTLKDVASAVLDAQE